MVVQDKEDECLMTALCSLASDGWRTHSLQQDGLLVEEGVRAYKTAETAPSRGPSARSKRPTTSASRS